MPDYDVVLKQVEPQLVAGVRRVLPNYQSVGTLYGELFGALGPAGALSTGTMPLTAAIYHDEGYKDHEVDVEAVAYLNPTDSRPEHVIANLDRPHRIVLMGMYELPFGRGRRFISTAHGIVDHVIGGWQMQAVWQLQSGAPLQAWGNIIYYGKFTDIPLSTDKRSVSMWFNTANFERSSAKALGSNIRTFPSAISCVRADGINITDVSIFKTFRLYERFRLQLRGEAEGVMNHPNFAVPNQVPTNSLFGSVNATQTGQEERRVFVGLKLMF